MEEQKLTKKEKYELRKQQKEKEQMAQGHSKNRKRFVKIAIWLTIILAIVVTLSIYIKNQPSVDESDIISRNGLHWHPELSIYIKGEKQTIPADIGIGAVHQPIHTHDDTGIIHLEMMGTIRKQDTTLEKFFEIWGKQFNSNCIFENCNGENEIVKFLVDGEVNSEFENYQMKDDDKLEIRFE